MKRGWLGILFCISFLFGLSEIKGKFIQDMDTEFPVLEQNFNGIICCSQGLPESEAELVSMKSQPSRFVDFNLNIFDYFTLTTLSSSPRGVSFSKPLKFIHTLQVHSVLHPPLFTKNSGVQYFHYCFVEASCRYYIYTLRRIII